MTTRNYTLTKCRTVGEEGHEQGLGIPKMEMKCHDDQKIYILILKLFRKHCKCILQYKDFVRNVN